MSTSFIYLGDNMEKVVTAFNVLAFYVGIEHFNTYDEDGNYIEVKEICLYSQNAYFKSNNVSRRKLVNMTTGSLIEIDQNGDCLSCDSEDREVLDITYLHSFKDCVKELLNTTRGVIDQMDNGKETNEWWEALDQLMDAGEQLNEPVLMEFESVMNVADAISNVYTLAYGNPLLNESKERCLLRFLNFNNKDKE